MYYAFEFVNGKWLEIAAGTCMKALEEHLWMAGVEDFQIIGW